MDIILGIDLGTTNSEVAVIRGSQPIVLTEDGDPILPSVVGLDSQGRLLVGKAARNQFVLAPERTIRSIKRRMGQDVAIPLGDHSFTPQEISAMILRVLRARAEKALGQVVTKAVITVPAFFNDAQREATREAGELAGFEVMRIINEPTAAVLTYNPHPPEMERLLVYDLGGGTFDVSIAQVEQGVVEILSSHGDTQLGGDDFDQRLLDFVCDRFQSEHGIDLRESLTAKSRLLNAVEDAKMRLSTEPIVGITEEFIAEDNGVPLHVSVEITREEYEELIEPLLAKTLRCVDDALTDAHLLAHEIDKVLLVGGATRTPMVHRLLSTRLGRPVHAEIEPDLAVAMGAAVQGGLIAGVDVGPVLVDITPHTVGIETLGERDGIPSRHSFSPIIKRNTPLPAVRTEMYATVHDGQDAAEIRIFQGDDDDTRYNELVGDFHIQGLADIPAPNQLLVRLELDLNGILRVTATERATGLAKQVVLDNAMERFRQRSRLDAQERLDSLLPMSANTSEAEDAQAIGPLEPEAQILDPALREAMDTARALLAKSTPLVATANSADADEMKSLIGELQQALDRRDAGEIRRISAELEDLVFYLADY